MDFFKTRSRKNGIIAERYQEYLIKKIREKYSVNDELAILRQKDTKPDEFAEYNEYVEACKASLKDELGLGGGI